ncbi:bis(5'-nucleosyl)-tetraphosphatase (symmetrical) YqeK [Paenibacillus qinlingensis]|uniref:HD superfamily hydrolase involved in NAD metabolism n=1 Tax=Paenibacillus qinlingensis TaxID=1837343 RepID=A0ABU1NVU0_9BACL|nr:bis(5'-nucleosyl)-tetraphosphatase (symmetrical) YqeK [Paenibacillus qinlingensis]MDR6551595.1 putative HD superfamily hydrolase involved in NAD metabolism [Paenibacillus qinlingensis]
MSNRYLKFIEKISFTGDLRKDIESFFTYHNESSTYQHTISVENEAVRIANLFGVNGEFASQAAYLHDISNVIPKSEMMGIAESSSMEILEDEYRYPRIIHQKLSRDMAANIFNCTNVAVLRAIECHTTLKAGASQLDKVLFVADKISWDLPGENAYQDEMRKQIALLDLNAAVLIYLNHVWEQRDKLKLVHPWLIAAREELLLSQV